MRVLTQPCLPASSMDPARLVLGGGGGRGRAISGKPQEEVAPRLCSQQPQGRRAAGGKGQWQWPPCSREEGAVLHITAHESGIFKRMCGSERSIRTKDRFQLKYEGACRPLLECRGKCFSGSLPCTLGPTWATHTCAGQDKPSSTACHLPSLSSGLDWGQEQQDQLRGPFSSLIPENPIPFTSLGTNLGSQ